MLGSDLKVLLYELLLHFHIAHVSLARLFLETTNTHIIHKVGPVRSVVPELAVMSLLGLFI